MDCESPASIDPIGLVELLLEIGLVGSVALAWLGRDELSLSALGKRVFERNAALLVLQ